MYLLNCSTHESIVEAMLARERERERDSLESVHRHHVMVHIQKESIDLRRKKLVDLKDVIARV